MSWKGYDPNMNPLHGESSQTLDLKQFSSSDFMKKKGSAICLIHILWKTTNDTDPNTNPPHRGSVQTLGPIVARPLLKGLRV